MEGSTRPDNLDRVTGWWIFTGILLFVAGVLNIIYGIAAIGDSKFFAANVTVIDASLNTYGWLILVLGVIELIAAFSLFSGGGFGRVIGIIAAGLAAIGALLTVGLSPIWSLCMFILAVVVIYELAKSPDVA
ncbi:MAG: DUF7144 family membrane protein [Solirubrobacterales bacterium]